METLRLVSTLSHPDCVWGGSPSLCASSRATQISPEVGFGRVGQQGTKPAAESMGGTDGSSSRAAPSDRESRVDRGPERRGDKQDREEGRLHKCVPEATRVQIQLTCGEAASHVLSLLRL